MMDADVIRQPQLKPALEIAISGERMPRSPSSADSESPAIFNATLTPRDINQRPCSGAKDQTQNMYQSLSRTRRRPS